MTLSSNDFARTLCFSEWPFGVVPDAERVLIWADRRELLSQLHRMTRRLSGSPNSTLHLLWADFGAGKTHTLLYLRQILQSGSKGVFPIYTVLPKETRSFTDVYRAIVSSITTEELVRTYRTVVKGPSAPSPGPLIGDKWNSVLAVLKALSMGSDAIRDSARKWISADQSLSQRELSGASLPDKIRTADDAIAALSSLARLMSLSNTRILLMIDEFQRTGRLRSGVRNDIQAGLRTCFSNCPKGLSMILSFKFGDAKEVQTYLSEELRDLADPQVIMIPVLDRTGAEEFLNDLLDKVKMPGAKSRMQHDVVGTLIERVSTVGTLKPRLISKTASLLFSEAAMDLDDGAIDSVSATYISDKFEQSLAIIANIAAEQEE